MEKVKNIFENAFNLFKVIYLIATLIGCFVTVVYIELTNIDSTRMRLFVDYWYVYLIVFIVACTDVYIMKSVEL